MTPEENAKARWREESHEEEKLSHRGRGEHSEEAQRKRGLRFT
jgi:hypothetical protein